MPVTEPSAVDRVMRVIQSQPPDSSLDEIVREVLFLRMIERGTADSDAGRVISHEKLKKRVASWSKSGGPKKPSGG